MKELESDNDEVHHSEDPDLLALEKEGLDDDSNFDINELELHVNIANNNVYK